MLSTIRFCRACGACYVLLRFTASSPYATRSTQHVQLLSRYTNLMKTIKGQYP